MGKRISNTALLSARYNSCGKEKGYSNCAK